MQTSARPASVIDHDAAEWLIHFDKMQMIGSDVEIDELRAADSTFSEWIDASLIHRTAFARVLAAWQRADRLAAFPEAITVRRAGFGRLQKIAAAVAVAALSGAALLAIQMRPDASDMQPLESVAQTYETALGEQETITLSDGSVIQLNTDTIIVANLTADERHVELRRGEAYFEIAHDASRPFTIAAGQDSVTVLGTKFSIQRLESGIEVLVTEGKVQIEEAATAGPLTYVTGGQRALTSGGSVLVEVSSDDQTRREMSWRTGRLDFAGEPLESVAAEFNRYNATKLVIVDDEAAAIPIGGSFKPNNVEAFGRLLRDGLGLEVYESEDEIRVGSAAN